MVETNTYTHTTTIVTLAACQGLIVAKILAMNYEAHYARNYLNSRPCMLSPVL